MEAKGVTTRIGVGLSALALSTAAVGLTASPAYALTQTPSGARTVILARRPKLICQFGGTCGTWSYFDPGEWCLTVFPDNENGTCTVVDTSFQTQTKPWGPVGQCIYSLVGSAVSVVIPYLGETTIGGTIFFCGWSSFGYYLG